MKTWLVRHRLSDAILLGSIVVGGIALIVVISISHRSAGATLWTASIAIAASLIGGLAVFRVVLRRVEKLERGLAISLGLVADGDYRARLPIRIRERLDLFAGEFDRMNDNLRVRFEHMQADRDQLRTVLDSMIEAVIALDAMQRILLINDAACRLFGVPADASIGRPMRELVRITRLHEWMAQALENPVPTGGELELLAPAPRIVAVRVARLSVGPPWGCVIVGSDITELRRLERVRQEFVANASHELKTPLSSIKAYVETLLDGAIDDMEHRTDFLKTIASQADRLDRLIRDMMMLSRVESGEEIADTNPMAVDIAINTCLDRYRHAIERKQIRLRLEAPPASVVVRCCEEYLEQIIDNLLDNAVKYTPAEGTITLSWRTEGSLAVIDVGDTGIGIPQKDLARIFERFYRVDRARSRELGGTGLGLSIVKHLTQASNGSVSVRSRIGEGTVFTVRLPLALEGA